MKYELDRQTIDYVRDFAWFMTVDALDSFVGDFNKDSNPILDIALVHRKYISKLYDHNTLWNMLKKIGTEKSAAAVVAQKYKLLQRHLVKNEFQGNFVDYIVEIHGIDESHPALSKKGKFMQVAIRTMAGAVYVADKKYNIGVSYENFQKILIEHFNIMFQTMALSIVDTGDFTAIAAGFDY